ncbi:hypothetical protein CORMATOL_00656 [Corynebacterium matruchotii ATCC 33806]|uniref:Uncharacterized protein n=2 Tax=Corynebacterium matruchotii TaxID=43768 RepID=E0DD36_9CORY|nr:hypothetical protein CORMATOL_00656 [Corynebacterium matruchotii ATCC 33806]EFM49922.1 hypothetical protein HMPREF0299_6236 [Corynebacterium matruchotii ATCC 14266]
MDSSKNPGQQIMFPIHPHYRSLIGNNERQVLLLLRNVNAFKF